MISGVNERQAAEQLLNYYNIISATRQKTNESTLGCKLYHSLKRGSWHKSNTKQLAQLFPHSMSFSSRDQQDMACPATALTRIYWDTQAVPGGFCSVPAQSGALRWRSRLCECNSTSLGGQQIMAIHSLLQLLNYFEEERNSSISKALIKKKKEKTHTKKLSISDNCNLKNTSKDLYSSTKRWTSVLWQWWESAATLTRDFKEPTTAEQVMWLCREMTATQTSQPVPELRGDFCEKRYSAISFHHFERKHSLW